MYWANYGDSKKSVVVGGYGKKGMNMLMIEDF
jgi:hypothetical protein